MIQDGIARYNGEAKKGVAEEYAASAKPTYCFVEYVYGFFIRLLHVVLV